MGSPITMRMPPRRFQLLFGLVAFVATIILLFGAPTQVPDHVPTVAEIQEVVSNPKLPNLSDLPSIPPKYNPFAPSAHKPPIQANSSSGESSWFSDWKWRNPFSSTITLDENRAVLPPLKPRVDVYTFYDSSSKKSEEVKKAEHELLLIWRRAWWAKGFKPVVLGRAEAMNNPLYQQMQRLQLEPALEVEMARWLAWGNMGTGVLANWLTVPMCQYEDPLLGMLRRGEFPHVTRFEGLDTGLFAGEKASINSVIKDALNVLEKAYSPDPNPDNKKKPKKPESSSMIDLVKSDAFAVDPKSDSIAFYTKTAIKEKYKIIDEALDSSNPKSKGEAHGLKLLGELINAHLHQTWQNTFTNGISIVRPQPKHMTHLLSPAVELAVNLTQCPVNNPQPATCPPNKPRCKQCISSTPLRIEYSPSFRNDTALFTLGVVPHPYTFASLVYQQEALDARFIRREIKNRDEWVMGVTIAPGLSNAGGGSRVVRFKDIVASEWGAHHTLWLTAERESHDDLDWIFGFALPRELLDRGESTTPVPGPERRPSPPKDENEPDVKDLFREKELLQKARDVVKSKVRQVQSVKAMTEAWSLADTEAWRFARAYSARRRVERRKWEEEERGLGAPGAESKGNGGAQWMRWWDHR